MQMSWRRNKQELFRRDIAQQMLQNGKEWIDAHSGFIIVMVIAGVIVGVGAIVWLNREKMEITRVVLQENVWGNIFLWMGSLFMVVNLAVLIWRIVLVCRYRPIPGGDDEQLPECTVVVPAYNEGRQVLITLRSLAASDYPMEKLQIIAVDDGSVDDTWYWIRKARQELGGRVKTIKLPHNQGKRHALYAGFQESRGDVLVTVDSDSTVEPQTLRCLVSPLVVDRRVGGVAGNVRVLNRAKGIIPRMLEVVFVYSFDFIRAGQSMVNTVMCTPGALSAYRRDVVLRVLEEWLQQTFCGRPANIGEDQAITNLILREGYHVLFQQNARVYTNVPTGYTNLCRMFLRWERSSVRETVAMSRFAFRRFRNGSMLGARINLLLSWLALTKYQLLLMLTWGLILWQPLVFGLNALLGIIISSSLPAGLYAWRYRSSEAFCAYVYGIFWFAALFWVKLYALLTVHQSGWLTRQVQSGSAPSSLAFKRGNLCPAYSVVKQPLNRKRF